MAHLNQGLKVDKARTRGQMQSTLQGAPMEWMWCETNWRYASRQVVAQSISKSGQSVCQLLALIGESPSMALGFGFINNR